MPSPQTRTLLAALVSAGLAVWLYAHVLWKLAHDWATDDNYSHGFLIVPIAAYFVWERRGWLKALPLRPSNAGLLVIAGSLMVLIAGTLGAELFLARISLVGVLTGTILFVAGWRHLRALAFPLAFLLLMIPIPAIIFNRVAFPLQLLASQLGTQLLGTAGIPVLREGNVIVLAKTSLEVAEACSGIRSMISLLALGIVLGYFSDRRGWVRATIAVATVPIAIVTNGLRVAGTGVAAHYYGPQAAEGFLHAFSGWLMFAVAIVIVFGVQRALTAISPDEIPSRVVLMPAGGA